MRQSLAPLTTISEAIPGVYLIWLESPEMGSAARPGQFVMVRCGEDNELLLRRPLSVHQVDTTKAKMALLFNVVGKGTSWLSQCKVGDNIDLFGPLGNGFSVSPDSRNLLLIAGGMGIAPLYFLATEALRNVCSVTLLCGTPTAHRYPESLLPHQVELVTATEDGTIGHKGMVTDLIPDFIGWADQIFACGPVPMYRAMAQIKELKGKSVQISLEMKMGCGFGICYGCTVKTRSGLKQVCKDGPVFELSDLTDINWDELIL